MYTLMVLLKISFVITAANCARIFVVNTIPAYSHQAVFDGIVIELSKRGHDLVSITTHPLNDKSLNNLREIDISFSKDIWIKSVNEAKPDMFNKIPELFKRLMHLMDIQMQHPEVQTLIKNKTEHFDLVILSFVSSTTFAYKVRFNCPLIGVITMDATNMDYVSLGNGVNSALHVDTNIYKPISNTLISRLYNFFMNSMLQLHRNYVINPMATKIIRKYFGEDYPDVDTLRRETDVLFVNANWALNNPRPLTACTVTIGAGIHIKPPKKLPKDLKSFLDNSKRGVIYISFGSNVQSAELPENIKQLFFKAFADLPYDIMWKYENETSLDVPKNMFMMKWMPQQDILRHKNVKLFITQGGLQSMEEAILNHVPMLSFPFYGDQLHNSHKIQTKKVGMMIDRLDTLTSEHLKFSILETIQNPMYKTNIEKLSTILTDQPMKPMEKVVWWTEYVIRHKGAKHLRGPNLPTYQLYLLDIFGILLLLLLFLLVFLYTILKYAFRKIRLFMTFKKLKVL